MRKTTGTKQKEKKHSLKNKTGSCYLAHTTSGTLLKRVASISSHNSSNVLHKLQLPPSVSAHFVSCDVQLHF